jgi:hypothetical protein
MARYNMLPHGDPPERPINEDFTVFQEQMMAFGTRLPVLIKPVIQALSEWFVQFVDTYGEYGRLVQRRRQRQALARARASTQTDKHQRRKRREL